MGIFATLLLVTAMSQGTWPVPASEMKKPNQSLTKYLYVAYEIYGESLTVKGATLTESRLEMLIESDGTVDNADMLHTHAVFLGSVITDVWIANAYIDVLSVTSANITLLTGDNITVNSVTTTNLWVGSATIDSIEVDDISDSEGNQYLTVLRADRDDYSITNTTNETELTITLKDQTKSLHEIHCVVGDTYFRFDQGQIHAAHNIGLRVNQGDTPGTHGSVTLKVFPAWSKNEPINCWYMLTDAITVTDWRVVRNQARTAQDYVMPWHGFKKLRSW